MTGSVIRRRGFLAAALAVPALPRPARAEATKLRCARQYGIGFLQMVLLENGGLVEKHAAAAGLGAVEVSWSTFRSSDVMNDALLSGGLDLACLGVPGLLTIADRTRGTRAEVRALCGLNFAPNTLVTREAGVRSVADYRPGMKIAVPAVKVSNQAIYLQMAAAKEWGPAEYARLDPLTVSMTHPDAVAALLSGGEIGSYFGSPPFAQRALKAPGVRAVTDSTAILGQQTSFNVVATPSRFLRDNPALCRAFLAAFDEATAAINADKAAAATTYASATGDRMAVPDIVEVMNEAVVFTPKMAGTLAVAQFMASVGSLKRKPEAWNDYVHEPALNYGGS